MASPYDRLGDRVQYFLNKSTGSYRGFNYEINTTTNDYNDKKRVSYHCNCSFFKTKEEVEGFIDSILVLP